MAHNKQQLRSLHLFAGAGGGILADILLGHRVVCAVEIEKYPRKILLQRQRDGILPKFPVWDDVTTFDGKPWRGLVDVIAGGFPCQDISTAGNGAGIDGERSGLWREMARIIGEVRPRFVFVENSPALTSRGLGVVLGDLAEMGYNARWGVLGAVDVGAPHKRDRIWVLGALDRNANSHNDLQERRVCQGATTATCGICEDVADANQEGLQGAASKRVRLGSRRGASICDGEEARWVGEWWSTEPDVGRVANGVAARVDRLKAIGNGQVPAVAALAWRLLGGE